MTNLRLAMGAVAIAALLLIFATRGKKETPPPQVHQFDETFDEVALHKSDKWPYKPIVTERIIPDPPASVPPVVELPEPVQRKVAEKRVRHEDICSRHGMRKVNYGRSWHCRK